MTQAAARSAVRTAGAVRRDAASRNWLTVLGSQPARHPALEYLRDAPVGDGLKNALASWQSQGAVADLSLSIPLDQPEADTAVHLELLLEENDLIISDYDLDISQLSGSVIYDSEAGFEPDGTDRPDVWRVNGGDLVLGSGAGSACQYCC